MNREGKNLSPIYDRDNIALFSVLKSIIDTKSCFIIANTHLLFNVNRGDIKLGQIYQVLNGLDKLKRIYQMYLINDLDVTKKLI